MPRSLATRDQRRRHRADLRYPAGRAVDALTGDRLHGVDDEQAGRDPVDVRQQRAQIVLGGQEQGGMHRAGAFGPQPNLRRRLLTGHDQRRRTASGGEAVGHVEQQRRLADARLARQQHDRTRHQPAAEHPVEFGDAGGLGPRPSGSMLADRPGRAADWSGRTDRTAAPAPTSISVPQAWHSGQRPTQRIAVAPHSAQRKVDAGGRVAARVTQAPLRAGSDRFGPLDPQQRTRLSLRSASR